MSSTRSRSLALATVTAVQPPGRYGTLNLDDDRARFMEKPHGSGGWVNGGFFVASPRILDYIDGDPHALFGTNIGAALTSALEVARKDKRPTRKVFLLVSDGEAVSTAQLCRELGEVLGRPARLVPFPPALLPAKLRASLEVNDHALRERLGWMPPHGRAAGMRATADWYLRR